MSGPYSANPVNATPESENEANAIVVFMGVFFDGVETNLIKKYREFGERFKDEWIGKGLNNEYMNQANMYLDFVANTLAAIPDNQFTKGIKSKTNKVVDARDKKNQLEDDIYGNTYAEDSAEKGISYGEGHYDKGEGYVDKKVHKYSDPVENTATNLEKTYDDAGKGVTDSVDQKTGSVTDAARSTGVLNLNDNENPELGKGVQDKKQDAKEWAEKEAKGLVDKGDDYVGASTAVGAAKQLKEKVKDSLHSDRSIISILEPACKGVEHNQYNYKIYVPGCISYAELKNKEAYKKKEESSNYVQKGVDKAIDTVETEMPQATEEEINKRVDEAMEKIRAMLPGAKQNLMIRILGFEKDPAVKKFIERVDELNNSNVVKFNVANALFENFCDAAEAEKKAYSTNLFRKK